jgi:hypothetical protein
MALNHTQIVKDYNKLKKMYDVPEDLTGGMVVEEVLMKAVEKGTKAACAKAIFEIIDYGFQFGGDVYRYQSGSGYKEVSIYDCDYVRYIYNTYLN